MNDVKRFDFTLTGHKNYQSHGSYVLAEDYDKLVEQVELLTAQKVALIEYIKNPPQPSEETKRINEHWRGYNER